MTMSRKGWSISSKWYFHTSNRTIFFAFYVYIGKIYIFVVHFSISLLCTLHSNSKSYTWHIQFLFCFQNGVHSKWNLQVFQTIPFTIYWNEWCDVFLHSFVTALSIEKSISALIMLIKGISGGDFSFCRYSRPILSECRFYIQIKLYWVNSHLWEMYHF